MQPFQRYDHFQIFCNWNVNKMSSNFPNADDQDAEETPHESRPISALAPTVRLQEESQVEVTASPAFQCLEEVKLCSTSMQQYKVMQTMLWQKKLETLKTRSPIKKKCLTIWIKKLNNDSRNFDTKKQKSKYVYNRHTIG